MAKIEITLDEDDRGGKAVIGVPHSTEEALARLMALAKQKGCYKKVKGTLSLRVTNLVAEITEAVRELTTEQLNGTAPRL